MPTYTNRKTKFDGATYSLLRLCIPSKLRSRDNEGLRKNKMDKN